MNAITPRTIFTGNGSNLKGPICRLNRFFENYLYYLILLVRCNFVQRKNSIYSLCLGSLSDGMSNIVDNLVWFGLVWIGFNEYQSL